MLKGSILSSSGAEIQQVSGTNASPAAWNDGCDAQASSCFGYHPSDDSLYGGSARFAAFDTYARMSTTTPEEVAYSSQPVTGEVNDIVFRILVRQLQDAGRYETNMMYISVPIF